MSELEFLREKQRQCLALARMPNTFQPAVPALEAMAAEFGAIADAAERDYWNPAARDVDLETFEGGWTAVMTYRG